MDINVCRRLAVSSLLQYIVVRKGKEEKFFAPGLANKRG
jgi:hypothetical protein